MKPKISVVLSTFNHLNYLPRAINSILNQQKFGSSWEILILDDGSTDDTLKYLSARFQSNNFIKLFRHKKNQGVQKSYHELLSMARGDYLIFVHSDDIYEPNMLWDLSGALDENPGAGLAYGAFNWIDEKENILRTVINQYVGYHSLLIENPGLSAVLFRRKIYEEVGGYDPGIGCRADQDLYLRIIEKSKAVYVYKILSQQRLDQNCKSYRDQVGRETEESLELLRDEAVERRRKSRGDWPVRVLFVVPSLPENSGEYLNEYINELERNLGKRQFDIFILSRGFDNSGVMTGSTNLLSYTSEISNLMLSVEDKVAEDLFVKFLDRAPLFDIIHFHHTIGFPFSLIDIAKKCGYPVCLSLYDLWMLCPKPKCCGGPFTVDNCAKCLLKKPEGTYYVNEIAQAYYEVAYRRAYLEYIWGKIDLIETQSLEVFESFNGVGLGDKIKITEREEDIIHDALQWEVAYQRLLK